MRAGVTPGEIKHRLASGALHRVHQGVYRVGHRAPNVEADYLAAVLACGPHAALSGRAAGHLLGLLRAAPPRPQVTVPTLRRVPGVIVRRSRLLRPSDVTTWRGVPVTTVPTTLVDLAGELSPSKLARASHEASVRFGPRRPRSRRS